MLPDGRPKSTSSALAVDFDGFYQPRPAAANDTSSAQAAQMMSVDGKGATG
jgi:hypothetical protein